MRSVVIPATAMLIYVGGRLGPEGIVTGKVAVSMLLVGLVSYVGCRIGDRLFADRTD